MEKIPVKANPGRLISAVANMGYEVEVALCDLIDNSFDAGATEIAVYTNEGNLIDAAYSFNADSYIICDNGSGMDKAGLINAFALGTQRDYGSGELGKFGLGLKSAGLSMGNKVTLLSKLESGELSYASLTLKDIQEEYYITFDVAIDEYKELWSKLALNKKHGTILIITELNDSQPDLSKFNPYFCRYCANVYHRLIGKGKVGFKINEEKIEPVDPLFWDEAQQGGGLEAPSSWSGKEVRLLMNEKSFGLEKGVSIKIGMTHLIHPPSFEFESESKRDEMRKLYQIDTDPYTQKARHGFYVYRNGRIIVMAERFHGLIPAGTSYWAFRARIEFSESADELLSLDVKKQHLKLPRNIRNTLKSIVSNYASKSSEAWKVAGSEYTENRKNNSNNTVDRTLAKTPINDLDASSFNQLLSAEQKKKIVELQKKVEKETLKSISDANINRKTLTENAKKNAAVILANGLKGNPMWLPYPEIEQGKVEIVLNNHNSWIAEALAGVEDNPKAATVLFQLLAILSRAELDVRSTPHNDLSEVAVKKVFERFRTKVASIGEEMAEFLEKELKKIDANGFVED